MRLDALAFRGAIGVIDDDCDTLDGITPQSKNVVVTDSRDLESLLLGTRALDKVLAEFGNPKSIQALESKEGESVREALFRRALPFGRLRWHSKRNGGSLSFKNLRPARFADEKAWTFDLEELFAVSAQGLSTSPLQLKQELSNLPNHDPFLLCHGHDLVDILSIGLRRVLGTNSPGRERVASTLRSGADASELEVTQLWGKIRSWESANTPYRVL